MRGPPPIPRARPGACQQMHPGPPSENGGLAWGRNVVCHNRPMSVDRPGCVIVTGMPGAGKTTGSDLAARLVPRGAQVGGDTVSMMIRSGWVGFMGEPTNEALRQDELCDRNMCALANNFVDFGFTVFLDGVLVDRAELDFFVALMSPRPVRLVILAPGIEVCKARNAGRAPEERFDFDGY